LSFSFIGKAQSFCDTMFGEKFISTDLYDFSSDTVFHSDTIDFYKGKKLNKFSYIQLKLADSSFQIYEGVVQFLPFDKDSVLPVATAFYISDNLNGDGTWKYDSTSNTISFKMISSDKWNHFRIEIKGKKGDNPYISWASNGDYRYLIRLIAVKD